MLDYLKQFGENLDRSFGFSKGSIEEEINAQNISGEEKAEIEEAVEDMAQGVEDIHKEEENVGYLKRVFSDFKKCKRLKDIIMMYGDKKNNFYKEFFGLYMFGAGIGLAIVPTPEAIDMVLVPVLLGIGYKNSNIIREMIEEKNIKKINNIDLEKIFKKED